MKPMLFNTEMAKAILDNCGETAGQKLRLLTGNHYQNHLRRCKMTIKNIKSLISEAAAGHLNMAVWAAFGVCLCVGYALGRLV